MLLDVGVDPNWIDYEELSHNAAQWVRFVSDDTKDPYQLREEAVAANETSQTASATAEEISVRTKHCGAQFWTRKHKQDWWTELAGRPATISLV